MKKLLAITLSLLMVFAVVPMAMISANAETKVGDSVLFYFGVNTNSKYSSITDNEKLVVTETTLPKAALTTDYAYPYYNVSKPTAGQYTLFTTPVSVDAGVYSVKFYTRSASTRGLIDIQVNDTVVATDLDTTSKNATNWNPFALGNVTLTKAGTFTVKVTAKDANQIWLGGIELTKTADYTSTDTPVTTSPISTDAKASIRLGAVNGIRFYSTIDEDAVATLNTENATVEYGTLIGPSDLIGDTLDIDDVTAGNAVDVKFTADEYYTEGDFSGIVGSIVDIKDKNIARDFTGCGYVKIGDTYYYSTTVSVRSLRTVATAYANDSYPGATDAQKALVDAWKDAPDYVG